MRQQVAITRRLFTYDKEGHQHWVEMEVFPILDDQGKSGFIAAVQRLVPEVTEQEEALRLNTANVFPRLLNMARSAWRWSRPTAAG